jgi:acetyltransferase-like isoleucine patch superfamily enzyme
LLNWFFGFEIHKSARIGKSVLLPRKLVLGEFSSIGSGNFAYGLEEIRLDSFATIGNLNWISGYSLGETRFFGKHADRYPQLHLQEHAIIVSRNLIDCTDRVVIGPFSALAGNWNQLLTHSVDLSTVKQSCAPIVVGKYCFIGGGSMILKGVTLADYCVVTAGSVVGRSQKESFKLMSGAPAEVIRDLSPRLLFFRRLKGGSD